MFCLENKIIVITGASSGIGEKCAITCSRMGAITVLFGRSEEKLKHVFSELEGQKHIYFAQDINQNDQFDSSISMIVKKYGAIDGFIHSAGTQSTLPLRLHNKEVYRNQLDVNVIAGFEACRIITKIENFNKKGGSLIFISSIRGLLGAANQIGYSASKGAVIAGARSLAIELAKRNIRVNSISPGMVEDTEMTKQIIGQLPSQWSKESQLEYPLGWVSTEDIANTCVFLLSDESKKITGTNIVVDGGFSAR
jgi:NAD(P)-dependent dehydrogenase (short-subunit alcohol dehydrogenase family)